MNRDLARHVVRAGFRSAAELQNLLPLLEDRLPTDEYERLRSGIATAIATIGTEVTNVVLASVPGLADEIETSLTTYGRLL